MPGIAGYNSACATYLRNPLENDDGKSLLYSPSFLLYLPLHLWLTLGQI